MFDRTGYDLSRLVLRLIVQLWPLWLFWFAWTVASNAWLGYLLTFPDPSTSAYALAYRAWPSIALLGPVVLMLAAERALLRGRGEFHRQREDLVAALETWLLGVMKNVLPRYVSAVVLNTDPPGRPDIKPAWSFSVKAFLKVLPCQPFFPSTNDTPLPLMVRATIIAGRPDTLRASA